MPKKTNKELIKALREYGRNCAVHSSIDGMGFPDIPQAVMTRIAEEYKRGFDLWWKSWMEPGIAEIERRLVRKKAEGR